MTTVAERELRAWHEVCRQLVGLGAVTAEDLKSATADDSSPGKRLFQAIRLWGVARAKLESI